MKHVIIDYCIGFEWDAGNRSKSQQKHDVTPLECEEVFFNVPLLITDDISHSQKELRYYALGHTNGMRRLFVAFTVRKEYIRIISARPMSKKERVYYETHTEI